MTFFQRALTRPVRRGAAVAGAVAAGTLLIAACGDNGAGSPAASPEAGASAAPAAGFNDADVAFAQGMIPHHRQALEMAELADSRASDREIKALAGRIEKAQDPEITTLRSWLTSWGKPESPASDHGTGHGSGHDDGATPGPASGNASGTASGMMSGHDMDALMSAKGADFDRKFARMMIDHHNGAIAMAEDEQKHGRNAAAKELAGDVVENQSAEVDQMRDILSRL
ncbi:DUF305 domain-containing protein [Streptomyces sp. FIT100]|uniref:DUF305 domain-containing protein n=1 Tax=Streptomyces sp. FIT100 TaxID=2837956 RepID=UPI0021C89A44|nr:DUF305 domain-containing protein [Streptomyces sp. FIT100]UUN25672.1 DUF305 domain-containing protein [Streptomyces sp. FIT100]